jgi:hypothetical protein
MPLTRWGSHTRIPWADPFKLPTRSTIENVMMPAFSGAKPGSCLAPGNELRATR